MRALSIRQPYAELILRGIKTVEYRSRPTRIVGERFWIYVPQGMHARRHEGTQGLARRIWSDDLAMPRAEAGEPPKWMLELAELLILGRLPRGVIVGSAVIEKCERMASGPRQLESDRLATGNQQPATWYRWHLRDVRRASSLRRPRRQPQPVWFHPF